MDIRPLDPTRDLELVTAFYAAAPEYWLMAEGHAPGPAKARDFFTDTPPGCDPQASYHLGLFLDGRLSGLAELSFGFPAPNDTYLGFMMLGPWAQGVGHGIRFLRHVERLARQAGSGQLFLAVLEVNARGHAFWLREGFNATGKTGETVSGDLRHRLHRLVKPL